MDSRRREIVRTFYAENHRELHTYALSLMRDQHAAEDVVHHVFEKLLRRLFLPRELRPYVYRAVRNAACDLLRRNHRALAEVSIFAAAAPHPLTRLSLREEAEHLLAVLSEDERECIILKLLNDLSFQEISAFRGVSINTAASWYRRGMEKMKRHALETSNHE